MKVSHWTQQSERASNWGIKFLIGVMKLTSPGFVKLLLVPVALYYFFTSPIARKASRGYLSRLLRVGNGAGIPANISGRYLCWLAFRHILSFSHAMVDRVHAWHTGSRAIRYRIKERGLVKSVFGNDGTGALVLVSHLGNFDLAIAVSKIFSNKRFNIVMNTSHTRTFNQFRNRIFESGQVRFIEPEAITPIEAMSLVNRVSDGEVVIIAADRTTNSSGKNSVLVNFLGDLALFPSGPYILAHILEVPVYTLFALKRHNDCLIQFELFEQKISIPRRKRQAVINHYAQKFATKLERECVNHPLQWYNFYDFWAKPEASTTGAKNDKSS